MSGTFTKSMARNIFYGGSAFFLLLFLALTFDTTQALPKRDMRQVIDPGPNATEAQKELAKQVALGKKVWEDHDCIGCHTLLGEGAYFAPELGNVYKRFGNSTDAIVAFIKSRPENGVPGRRSMPQFHMSDKELNAVAQFLKYASEINSNNWPPNIQG